MANPDFGTLLAFLRTRQGLTQAELGEKLLYSRSTVTGWEVGRAKPSREMVMRIGDALHLGSDEINHLLNAAEYAPLAPSEVPNSSATVGGTAVVVNTYPDPVREMQVQVADIQASIEALNNRVESKFIQETDNQSIVVSEEVQNLRDALRRLETTSREVTAPVTLPSSEDMAVRLVPSTLLERLEEYRSEENKWSSWTGIFVGAVLGIIINIVTGGSMNNQAWVVLAILVAMIVLTAWSAWTYRQRGNNLKRRLLNNETSSSMYTTK